MNVKDVVSKHAECISPTASLQTAVQQMRDLDVGLLPVCEYDRIVGIITDRDIIVRGVCQGYDPKTTTVSEIMTPEIVFCFEDQDVQEAARLMRNRQIRRLAVLSRNLRFIGIISLGDLAVEFGDEHLALETLERVPAATARVSECSSD
jgi:CBS domain-containing protein